MIPQPPANFHLDPLILRALQEDMPYGDLTTEALVADEAQGQVHLICKASGVLAGLPVFARTFTLLDPSFSMTILLPEGSPLKPGSEVALLRGRLRALLSGERLALNFLQHLSGIATATQTMSRMLEGTSIQLLDTRKTTPGLRFLEKYAVAVGGGVNHRFSLSEACLIKDNHIRAAGSIKEAVRRFRSRHPRMRLVEVETESLAMVQEALEAGADIIMLDNMDETTMEHAIALIAGKALVECSGNITKKRLALLTRLGVDFISSGEIIHSAPIVDFSLKELHLTS